MNQIYNNNCFDVFDTLDDNIVNMVLVDLPYGQTNCDWDIKIDLNEMWKCLKRICKDNCIYVFFVTSSRSGALKTIHLRSLHTFLNKLASPMPKIKEIAICPLWV